MTTPNEAFQIINAGHQAWAQANRDHRLAPPDAGFSHRLANFARAAAKLRDGFQAAAVAGLGWKPQARVANALPPYELRPESGRRGPAELWQAFDAAIDTRRQALEGTDARAIAEAFAQLAAAARQLAVTVAEIDGIPLDDETEDGDSAPIKHAAG
jgi:hypothetical protein